jgi:ABC-type multidrug transport system fused ATPase/permease subunit
MHVYGVQYWLLALWKLIWAAFIWACAYYFFREFLAFFNQANKNRVAGLSYDPTVGHAYAGAILISCIFCSIAIHRMYAEGARISIVVRAALQVAIYRKALRLARVKGGAGEVINILSTDVSRIADAVVNFHFMWTAIVETALIIALAFVEIREAALPILFIIIVLIIQGVLGNLTSKAHIENTKVTTERVHIMSEILTAIKLIKFYAWEQPFSEKVSHERDDEMRLVLKAMIIKSFNFAVVFSAPVIVTLASLCVFFLTDFGGYGTSGLDSAVVTFTVISLYNTLRYPLLMLPLAVKSTVGALNAFERVDTFLTQPELEPIPITPADDDTAFEIVSIGRGVFFSSPCFS